MSEITPIYLTYFDSNYLIRGLTLIRSIRRFDTKSKIVILALDEASEIKLKELNVFNTNIINLFELEKTFPNLLVAKNNRTRIEYIFTLTPFLFLYLLRFETFKDRILVYVDADLFFFSDPKIIYQQMDGYSIGIIPHRFSEKLMKKLSKYGKYNVGMVIIKNNSEGFKVIDWWSSKCLEWCHDYVENDKFAEQKYLESFHLLSESVFEISHLGANLAPWNIGNYELAICNNYIKVNEDKLIFFHFHALRKYKNKFIIPNFLYRAKVTSLEKYNIYLVYLEWISLEINKSKLDNFIYYSNYRSSKGILNSIYLQIKILTQIYKKNYL